MRDLTRMRAVRTEYETPIAESLRPFATPELRQRLDAIPGINQKTIDVIVVELGVDMTHFPSSGQVSSWAGLCPGNEQSAGKLRRGRTTKGNVWLRRALSESAWAVAHSLLLVIDHLLKDPKLKYQDLGVIYFDTLDPERLRQHLVKRLER